MRGIDAPEEEVVLNPVLEYGAEFSICLIQKNDRGRQGRDRIMLIFNSIKKSQLEQIESLERKQGKLPARDKDNETQDKTVFIQSRMRGILARKQVDELRQKEMEFLGMIRPQKPVVNNWMSAEDH